MNCLIIDLDLSDIGRAKGFPDMVNDVFSKVFGAYDPYRYPRSVPRLYADSFGKNQNAVYVQYLFCLNSRFTKNDIITITTNEINAATPPKMY